MPTRRQPAVLTAGDLKPIVASLRKTHAAVARAWPGETGGRQPVHSVYGGAHLFKADTIPKLGALARAALDEYAPDGATLARALDLQGGAAFAETIRARVAGKLHREPIEDFRLDFEDGYGYRPDAEEDGHAQSSAAAVAEAHAAGQLPPFIGIRIKPMSNELHARSLRTLDLFVTTLARALGRRLPPHFVVTLPKAAAPGHVRAVARACGALEKRLGLKPRTIRLELMIETPQSILDDSGRSGLRALVRAGDRRVSGAHFGAYDYTALCGITSSWQHMRHQACDFARHMMQVALAQTGVHLSDSVTAILPVGPHRPAAGRPLTDRQRDENRAVVHRAWKLHFDDIQHSLVNGFYQGWDLHPAQLVTRYAAVYAFFLASRPAATARLKNFIEKAAQATLVGDVFDDAATGEGLLNFFVRGLTSGALTPDEAQETGLTLDELQGRSFLAIVEGRRRRATE